MMYPADLRYTKTHEWTRLEDGLLTIGITSYASEELSDIVYVELPNAGDNIRQGAAFATLESVKAVSDVYSPASGVIDTTNQKLKEEPGLINESPYGDGWIARLRPSGDLSLGQLMDADSYASFVEVEKGG